MADEGTETLARDFLKALQARHVEQILALFSDDGTWIAPEGTFTGKASIGAYLDWQFNRGQDFKITECENGVVVEGNRAFIEHTIAFTLQGGRAEYVALSALELKNGRVKRIRTVYDRLSLERQIARGPLSRWAVDRLVRQEEDGLYGPRQPQPHR